MPIPLKVVMPSEAPQLTPEAARAFLKLLVAAAEKQRASGVTSQQRGDTKLSV